MRAAPEQPETKNGISRQSFPSQNDPPSVWPSHLKKEAMKIGSAVIMEWKSFVEQHTIPFVILYVPSGDWMKELAVQDSWRPWLEALCRTEQIPFIDPSDRFRKAKDRGYTIYYDHFTPHGHEEFAQAFGNWFVTDQHH